MARPTSARASAGASLTPSPTIATLAPRCWSWLDCLVLVLREHLGEHLADAEITSDGVGDLFGVTGDHRHLDAHSAEIGHGLAGLRADLVLQRQAPTTWSSCDQVEHRRAASLPAIDRLLQVVGHRRALAPAAAPGRRRRSGTPSMVASTPRPVSARNARADGTSPRCRGGVDDRSRQWVLAV